MLLVDYNGAAAAVAAKAKAQGIPVIAYDRPFTGADYYVSFDNEKVGELEGQMIVDGLKAAGKDAATAKVADLKAAGGVGKEAEDKLLTEMPKVVAAARSGKVDDLKAAVGAAGPVCKNCHDNFRQ